MGKINYIEGQQIGHCIFIKELDKKRYTTEFGVTKYRNALFKCSCNKLFECRIDKIKREEVKSCGCLQKLRVKEAAVKKITHGLSYNPIFHTWSKMKQRCENPRDKGYKDYGGRGIKVCDRWQDPKNFIDDMYGSFIEGYQLDRINNDGNYEPSNCRWATRKVNCNNRRSNIYITYKGIEKTLTEWCEYTGIAKSLLTYRIKHWDDMDKIFTEPSRIKNKRRTIN